MGFVDTKSTQKSFIFDVDLIFHVPGNGKDEKKSNRQLYGYLTLLLDDDTNRMLNAECKYDGVRAWNLVCQRYNSVHSLNMKKIRKELLNMKLEENQDLNKYVDKISELVTMLRNGGKKIEDEDICDIIIAGLPDSYEQFITMYTFTDNTSLEKLKELLRNYAISKSRCGAAAVLQDMLGVRCAAL